MFNKKVICIITLLFLAGGSLVCCPNGVFAYSSTPTHPNLTEEMIRLYNLYYDPDITGDVYERIIQGSVDEDMAPRWSFHLYDPIYNRAPFNVATAKQWAIGNIQGDAIHKFANALFNIFGTNKFSYHGDFSWTANINNFAKNKTDKAWYGLGHTLHLIADMTVPAHSRNDHHVQGDPFESWTGANLKNEDYNFADGIYKNNKYDPIDLNFVSDAFDDLAIYSNKYFFSKDSVAGTNLGSQYNGPKIVDIKEYDFGKYITKFYAMSEDENGKLFKLARINGLKTEWNQYAPNVEKKTFYEIPDNDRNIHLDYWQRLAPKAAEYGTGVIKLFVENAEYEKERLARQKKSSNLAQVLNPNPVNSPEINFSYVPSNWSSVEPGGLPILESIIVEMPVETPIEIPIITPLPENDTTNEQNLNQEQDNFNKGKEKKENPINFASNQNQPIVVTGQQTGGSGGVAPGHAPIDSSPQTNQDEDNDDQDNNLPEPDPHLLINEIQVRDNEFVELYNPTSSSIDLSGYYFSYYSSNKDWNDPHLNREFLASESISANGYYLIGLEGYPATSGNPESDWQIYDSKQLSNLHGSVAIFSFDPTTKTANESQLGAIDAVAWASASFVKEKTEFPQELKTDKSMQRINFKDDNDNSTDFEYKTIPSPTNSQNQIKTKGTSIPDNLVITEDTTWTTANSPYYITSNHDKWPIVETGITLTIEPGVIVMPENPFYTFLEIRGTLKAEGTASDKIVFTPKNDSDYGGTGGAVAGDMKNILFTSTSIGSILDHTLFRYGGKNSEVIKIDGSFVEIKNSTIENVQTNGIYLNNSNSTIKNTIIKNGSGTGIIIEGSGSAPEISDCEINNYAYGVDIKDGTAPEIKNNSFSGNTEAPIYLRSAYPEFYNNNATNNTYNGIVVGCKTVIAQDATWNKDLVYILEMNSNDYVTVNENITLTIEPGTILKPINQHYTPLVIKGALKAEGNSSDKIVFTSINDDSIGGDTNNNVDATIPASGDWKKIVFETTSTDSVLDYVSMYYGTGAPPVDLIGSASVDIKGTVEYSP